MTGPRPTLESAFRAASWLLVYVFLFSYLPPQLLFSNVAATGGDTASHFPSLVYFVKHVLPAGKISGWHPGNYAGFPLFQLYFPLPFLVMAVLGGVLPLAAAFNLVTVAGIFTLPPAAFYFLKSLGFRHPAPDLGGIFSLAFLFMEANSAWGGNIPSTLAGEFTYSIGLSLSLVFLGRLYRDIDRGHRTVGNAVLLALVGLSHGYTLLLCVLCSGFFLLTTRNWVFRLVHLLKVNILAFCLMGFWIVPLILFLPYSTPFNFVWIIDDWRLVLPVILWPLASAGAAGAIYAFLGASRRAFNFVRDREGAKFEAAVILRYFEDFKRGGPDKDIGRKGGVSDWLLEPDGTVGRRSRYGFLAYLILISAVFYLIAFKIGVVDVRFIPPAQLCAVLLGAAAVGRLVRRLGTRNMVVFALALLTCVWAARFERNITPWARWNYSGWETKPLWPAFKEVNDHLKGDFGRPRVVYEHAAATNGVGTIRAFESLPYFAGRATLEGLYIQASLSAPFAFYIQSEVSREISAPLSMYNYSRFDLDRARKHLDLFNVGQYVAVTPESRAAAEATDGYVFEKSAPPFSVFRVEGGSGRYVVQPRFRPVLAVSDDIKRDSFSWFRKGDLEVPLAFGTDPDDFSADRFSAVLTPPVFAASVAAPPRSPLPANDKLEETVRNEEIVVDGAVPGRPLLIKVSYHPDWKVEGANKVWRTAPSFMMVFPEKTRVRLYFARGWPDYLGLGLTLAAGFYIFIIGFLRRPSEDAVRSAARWTSRLLEPLARRARPRAGRILGLAVAVLCAAGLYLVAAVSYEDPTVYLNRGLSYFNAKEYGQARAVFLRALQRFPMSREADRTLHHMALCDYNESRFQDALAVWDRLTLEFPESRLLPEVLFHQAECQRRMGAAARALQTYIRLLTDFPDSDWAFHAERGLIDVERLVWEERYGEALGLFQDDRFEEARPLFAELAGSAPDQDRADRTAYLAAFCLYREKRWAEAAAALETFVADYPEAAFEAEARYHLGMARLNAGDRKGAAGQLRKLVTGFPDGPWRRKAERALEEMEGGRRP